jgi:hypothetical protein
LAIEQLLSQQNISGVQSTASVSSLKVMLASWILDK